MLDEEEEVTAPAVIVATGAKPRPLGMPGETELRGRGLSYCATCDGAYFEGKDIHVIGGGNSAVEESLFLTQFARSVTIIHQFDHFQAEAVDRQGGPREPQDQGAVEPRAARLPGQRQPRSPARSRISRRTRRPSCRPTASSSSSACCRGPSCSRVSCPSTSGVTWKPTTPWPRAVPGLYVAGDIRAKKFRQITTAVADGTIAALAVQKFLRESRVQ